MIKNLVKIEKCITQIAPFKKINIIGDPGCDGLGAATMSIFARALTCFDADFSVIAGDIVPFGSKQLYINIEDFVNTVAVNPVYTVCGNHDTDFYNDFFGLSNYALVNNDVLILALDNSHRKFTEDTLDFCKTTLDNCSAQNIIILFHIPAPNSYTANSLSDNNWSEFRKIYSPYKNKIRYFICGHVHSYFEDSIDGIPLIVTGGGGARIEYVSDKVERKNIHNHILQLSIDENKNISHNYINIEKCKYEIELEDETLKRFLNNAFSNETIAHFKYKLFSETASEHGLPGLAKLFRALSDSEYYHAKNHFSVLSEMNGLETYLNDSIKNEQYEIDIMYREYLDYSIKKSHGLAGYSFFDSLQAEKVHKPLLEHALASYLKNEDIPITNYYTCSSCGHTFRTLTDKPKLCPVCGAPHDKIMNAV